MGTDDERINTMNWKEIEEGILRFFLISKDLRWIKARIRIKLKLKLGLVMSIGFRSWICLLFVFQLFAA